MNDYTKNLTAVGACALGRAFGYEPLVAHRLLEATGSVEALFSLSEKEREELLGPFSRYRGRLSGALIDEAARELETIHNEGYRFISLEDENYPALLRECPDCPLGLYIRSDSPVGEIFDGAPCISIVGTRDISPYGKEWCRRIVFALSQAPVKPVIVSGMALGVDITAHQAAMEAGLRTIGVLPTGIDDMYPNFHRKAADRICALPGSALITDFPTGTTPQAATFLRRNRIIAGLSGATILVESKKKGGGLITANTAFSYGREVWVLPGRIEDPRSQGCLLLAAGHIAEIISDVTLLPEALGLGRFNRKRKAELADEIADRYKDALSVNEVDMLQQLATFIKLNRGHNPEEISEALGWDYMQTRRRISRLCSDGFVEQDLLLRCAIVVRNA